MSDLWATPQGIFDDLKREFNLEVDVCALPENAKCPHFFTPSMDGLTQSWLVDRGGAWMNPPYGRGIDRWVKKAFDTGWSGGLVVSLLPTRTNAPWWHEYVMRSREIRFVRKKVSFGGPVKGVPFWGNAIVIFGRGLSNGQPIIRSYTQPASQKHLPKHEVRA